MRPIVDPRRARYDVVTAVVADRKQVRAVIPPGGAVDHRPVE